MIPISAVWTLYLKYLKHLPELQLEFELLRLSWPSPVLFRKVWRPPQGQDGARRPLGWCRWTPWCRRRTADRAAAGGTLGSFLPNRWSILVPSHLRCVRSIPSSPAKYKHTLLHFQSQSQRTHIAAICTMYLRIYGWSASILPRGLLRL